MEKTKFWLPCIDNDIWGFLFLRLRIWGKLGRKVATHEKQEH